MGLLSNFNLGTNARRHYPFLKDYDVEVLYRSPVAFWKLDEGATGTSVDHTGTGHDLVNTNTSNDSLENLGNATGYTGTSHSETASFPVITEYPLTVSIWIVTSFTGNNAFLWWAGDSNANDNFLGVEIDGFTGKVLITIKNGSNTDEVSSITEINNGNVHMVTSVFKTDSTQDLYINGLKESTLNSSILCPTINNITIGRSGGSNPGSYSTMTASRASVFDKELTESEILFLSKTGNKSIWLYSDGIIFHEI